MTQKENLFAVLNHRGEMRRVMSLFWPKQNLIAHPKSYVPGFTEILLDEARRFNAELGN